MIPAAQDIFEIIASQSSYPPGFYFWEDVTDREPQGPFRSLAYARRALEYSREDSHEAQ